MKLYKDKIWFLLAAILAILTAWDFHFMSYWKDLVVYIHEIFHALGVILTGGKVQQIILSANEAGETVINRSSDFGFVISVSAGYIGSSLTGGFFLYRGFAEKFSRIVVVLTSLMIITFVTAYSITDLYTFNIGLYWGILFLALAVMSRKASSLILVLLGTCMSLYSLYDLLDFVTKIEGTDAGILSSWLLSRIYKVEKIEVSKVKDLAEWIAGIWSFFSLTVILFFVKNTISKKISNEEKGVQKMFDHVENGNVSADVADWFLEKGVDFEGRPLPENIVQEIYREK